MLVKPKHKNHMPLLVLSRFSSTLLIKLFPKYRHSSISYCGYHWTEMVIEYMEVSLRCFPKSVCSSKTKISIISIEISQPNKSCNKCSRKLFLKTIKQRSFSLHYVLLFPFTCIFPAQIHDPNIASKTFKER